MNPLRWALLLAGLALAACAAPDPAPPPSPALWEIAGTHGQPAGWLFGTVHALPAGTAWRPPRIGQALEKARVLVVEVGNIEDTGAIGATFRAMASDEPSPPLAARLSPDLQRQLGVLLERDPGLASRLDGLETWAAALTVARLASPSRLTQSVDADLVRGFRPRPVRELEGASAQLELFDALPERDQRDLLAAVIAEGSRGETYAEQTIAGWRRGDLTALERETRRGMLADPELREALLIQRNRTWAEKIALMIEGNERPFVAVGAAHLVGADGLIALLQRRGYRLHRIQ